MNAGQLLTIFLMGLAIRVNPLACGRTFCCLRVPFLLPISRNCAISNVEFIMLAGFWVILLLPIPFSRVANDDHTVFQVCVGMLVGVIAGLGTFAMLVSIAKCCRPCRCPKGKCYLVQHDIVLPWWYENELEDDDSSGSPDSIGRPLEGSGWRGVAWPVDSDFSEEE